MKHWFTAAKMKILLNLLTVFLFFIFIIFSDLFVYGFKQLNGQLKTLYYTENINIALASPIYSIEDKRKIKLVQDVKCFAENNLGFRETNNFTRICNQKLSGNLWVVEGCELFSFNEFTWQFPFLGKVSYKGYFDLQAAKKEKDQLIRKGYDASIGTASAWSTLGIFNDPILSGNLRYKKSTLVNLIFHELFHSTYYAKSSVDLNENLANFIAHKASLLYLTNDSILLNEYTVNMSDDSIFKDAIFKEMNRLKLFYRSLDTSDTTLAINLKKNEFQRTEVNLLRLKIRNKVKLVENIKKMHEEGNTYFCGIKKYDGLYDSLDKVLKNKYKNNLKQMILDFKSK